MKLYTNYTLSSENILSQSIENFLTHVDHLDQM